MTTTTTPIAASQKQKECIRMRTSSFGSGILMEENDVVTFDKSPMTKKTSTLSTTERTSSSSSLSSSAEQAHKNNGEDYDIELCSPQEWLGGEPPLLDREVELQGVRDILKGLTVEEKQALPPNDPTIIIRHFRAQKGKTPKAIASLKHTLAFRNEWQVDRLRDCFVKGNDKEYQDMMRVENATGKVHVRGTTHDGRALVYMFSMGNNTPDHPKDNMRHLMWNLEKAIQVTRASAKKDKYILLMDLNNYHMSAAPSMATSKLTLEILQTHYPERMYRVFLVNPPWAFRVFYNLIQPFIDPVTKEKVVMVITTDPKNAGLLKLYETVAGDDIQKARDVLDTCFGGNDEKNKPFVCEDYLTLPIEVPY